MTDFRFAEGLLLQDSDVAAVAPRKM